MQHFSNVAEAEEGLKTISEEELSKAFTMMVVECKGMSGCGEEYAKVIEYMWTHGAKCTGSIKLYSEDALKGLNYAYKILADKDQQKTMELMCPDVEFEGICLAENFNETISPDISFLS